MVQNATIESFALTVSAIRNFVFGMPEREVVIRFPYTSMKASVATVNSWLEGLHENAFVWDSSRWYVLAKAEKSAAGWMCLTFNWRYWMYFNRFGPQLVKEREELILEEIDDAFGRAYARYEAGISREALRDVIPHLLYYRDRFVRRFSSREGIVNLVEDPVALIQQASALWDENPGYLNISFIGGGFGLGGAISGMADAYLLNSMVNSYNKKLTGQVNERVSLPLAYGFGQLRATQSLLAGTLLFPEESLRETEHGTDD